MIETYNQTDWKFDIGLLEELTRYIMPEKEATVELIVCNNSYMQELNIKYRKNEHTTDVLSFPMHAADPGAPLGSIAISVDYVKEVASQLGHTEQEEFALLFIHGMLHLLGYDHESDEGTMRELEKEIIEKFHLPQSLILRNEEK